MTQPPRGPLASPDRGLTAPAEWAQCETGLSGALGGGNPNAEPTAPNRTPMVIGLVAIAVIVAMTLGFVIGLAAA